MRHASVNRTTTTDTNAPLRHTRTPARPYRHGDTDAAIRPHPRALTRPRPRAHARKTNSALKKAFIKKLWTDYVTAEDMILSQHRVRRDEQTERVCAVYASNLPIRRATNTTRPRHRTDVATRPHPQRRPRPFYVGIFGGLTLSTFQMLKTM